MPDDGDDVDPRAAAALAALRDGRRSPQPRALRGPAGRAVARLGELTGLEERRLLAGAAVVVGAVVLGALAWLVVSMSAPGRSAPEASPFAPDTVADPALPATSAPTTAPGLVVHAAGAVRNPGLYRVAAGARVADLLEAAGGPTDDTDLDRVNLAAPLADGQRLYVPHRGEAMPPSVAADAGSAPAGSGAAGSGSAPAGPLDLNTATAEQLDALPGVGPATAAAIVDHRQRKGPFRSVDDLLDVRGIGPAKLEGLRDLVAVG